MDRDEAIRLLKGGPDGVHEWDERRGQGEEIPALSGADLSGADLSGADLSGAVLRRANLLGADLRGTDFRLAVLSQALLLEADLSGADLRRAILNGAVLHRTVLSGAVLSGLFLSGADLSDALCDATVFGNVDLSKVKGLESIRHKGPSAVGVETLIKSRGRIPEAFLRGCGVPERLITYLPSLFSDGEPIQFYSCFISHSTLDKAPADRLHGRMVQEKLRVWYAPHDMRGGRPHDEQIDQAIRVYDKLLLVLSEASMGSEWVRREIRKARQQEKAEGRRKLFPIRLVAMEAIKSWECVDPRTGQDFAEEVLRYHIPDFSVWMDHDAFEAAFARLIRDLKASESTGEGDGREGPPERP